MDGRTLLIDADILIFQAASRTEYQFGDGEDGYAVDEKEARIMFSQGVNGLREKLGTDNVVLALSDYTAPWRKTVLPTYKSHRKNIRKPQAGIDYLRGWVKEAYPYVYQWDHLEGDDVLGIILTAPTNTFKGATGQLVCCTMDKDLQSVPGYHYRWPKNEGVSGGEVKYVSELEADRWHMYQTLTGDPVDGYKGCPKVGPVKAEKLLQGASSAAAMWSRVVTAYAKAKVPYREAIKQAQVARILRYGEYNHETREVKLWGI